MVGDGRTALSTDSSHDRIEDNQIKTSDGAEFARTVVWLLRLQAVLAVFVAVALALIAGRDSALAGMAGGGIGLVLTALAALRAGTAAASGEPARMVAAFYRAMAMKLVVAVVLFTIVARWFAPWFGPVLIGYGATLVAYWVALLRMGRKASPARK